MITRGQLIYIDCICIESEREQAGVKRLMEREEKVCVCVEISVYVCVGES